MGIILNWTVGFETIEQNGAVSVLTNQSEPIWSWEQTYFLHKDFPPARRAARALNFKLIPAFLCPEVAVQKLELDSSQNRDQEERMPQLKWDNLQR